MDDKKVLANLKKQITEGKELVQILESVSDTFFLQERTISVTNNINHYGKCMKWWQSSANILEMRFGKGTDYAENFRGATKPKVKDGGEFYKENVMLGNGVLESVYYDLKSDLTEDLFYKQELLLFSDLLEQAFEFLEKGHRLASAIYGRIVLETTIREYAKKFNIEKSKFNSLIIELKKKGVILQTFEDSLRANYNIGSMAAHGNKDFDKVKNNELKGYLAFIRV